MHFKHRLARYLEDRAVDGAVLPPGGAAGVRLPEADGRELAAVSRGEGLDFYFAGRRDVVAFACAGRTARRLAWFVVWTWWVRGTWCGLKLFLWRWAVRAHPAPLRLLRRGAGDRNAL